MTGNVAADADAPLLRVENLSVGFSLGNGGLFRRGTSVVKAVDGVSFQLASGETLGLVGESGCGKSTTGLSLLRMVTPSGGSIYLDGRDIAGVGRSEMRSVRREIQMVFQDPFGSLNPRMKIKDIIAEPLLVHRAASSKADIRGRTLELLELVGLRTDMAHRYPHEFSGGQRQRIGIARAIALNPRILVCDEPISALDVSIQAQIINLLERLQDEIGLSYLFISHDLSVVRYISHRVAVMYLGKIVEIAGCDELYEAPLHPYTQALIAAVPIPSPAKERARQYQPIIGEVPSPINPPSGCRFHPRCPFAQDICREREPVLKEAGDKHQVACHLVQ